MFYLCSSYCESYEELLKKARKVTKGNIVAIIPHTSGLIFKKQWYNILFYRWIDKKQ